MRAAGRLVRTGVASAMCGAAALTGVGLVAGPAGAAIAGDSASFSLHPISPATIAPATPLVPSDTSITNDAFTLNVNVVVGPTGTGTSISGVAFSIGIPKSTFVDQPTFTGWTTPPTCSGMTLDSGPTGTTLSCAGGAIATAGATTTATVVFPIFVNAAFDDAGPSSWSATLSPVTTAAPAGGSITPSGATQTVPADDIVPEALPSVGLAPSTQTVFVGNDITQIVSLGSADTSLSDAAGVVVTVTPPAIGGVPLAVAATPAGCVGSGGPPFTAFRCETPASGGNLAGVVSATDPPTTWTFQWVVPASAVPQTVTTTAQLTGDSTDTPPYPGQPPTVPLAAQTATATIVQPLAIQLTGPTSVVPGTGAGNASYTVRLGVSQVVHAGVVTVSIPTGMTYAGFTSTAGNTNTFVCTASASTVTCGPGAAAPGLLNPTSGSGDTIVINLTAPAGDTATPASLTARATSSAPNEADQVSSTFATALAPHAAVTVTKAQATPSPSAAVPANEIPIGAHGTYTITVKNAGPSNAAGYSITDAVSASGVTVNSLAQTGGPDHFSCSGATCSIASLPVNSTADTFTATVTVNSSAGLTGTPASFTNRITGSSPTPGAATSATVVSVVNVGADLQATLTAPAHFPDVSGTVPVTFGVANNGPLTALNPTATLRVPSSVTFMSVSSSPPGSTCTSPRGVTTITCTLNGNLASGSAVSWTVQAFYPVQSAATLPNVTVTNSVGFGPGTPTASIANFDPATGNNTAAATTTPGSPAAPTSPNSPSTPSGRSSGGF